MPTCCFRLRGSLPFIMAPTLSSLLRLNARSVQRDATASALRELVGDSDSVSHVAAVLSRPWGASSAALAVQAGMGGVLAAAFRPVTVRLAWSRAALSVLLFLPDLWIQERHAVGGVPSMHALGRGVAWHAVMPACG